MAQWDRRRVQELREYAWGPIAGLYTQPRPLHEHGRVVYEDPDPRFFPRESEESIASREAWERKRGPLARAATVLIKLGPDWPYILAALILLSKE